MDSDIVAQTLRKLEQFYQAGKLTPEEYEAAKAMVGVQPQPAQAQEALPSTQEMLPPTQEMQQPQQRSSSTGQHPPHTSPGLPHKQPQEAHIQLPTANNAIMGIKEFHSLLEHHTDLTGALKELGDLHKIGILQTGEFQISKRLFMQALQKGPDALSGPPTRPPASKRPKRRKTEATHYFTPLPRNHDTQVEAECVSTAEQSQKAQEEELFRQMMEATPADNASNAGLHALLAHYQLDEPFASGSQGQSYRAMRFRDSKERVLKVIYPHYSRTEEQRRQLQTLLTQSASLRHQHIRKSEFVQPTSSESPLVMDMEHIKGISLEELLQPHRSLDFGTLLPIGIVFELLSQISSALLYAHEQGVLHLSLKPGNILIDEHGCVKVCDFAVAQGLNLSANNPHIEWKKLAYFTAPEQIRNADTATPANDIYSLAALARQMLTGELSRNKTHNPPPREIPLALKQTNKRGSASLPHLRYPEVVSVWNALKEQLLPLVQERPAMLPQDALRDIVRDKMHTAILPQTGPHQAISSPEQSETLVEVNKIHSQSTRQTNHGMSPPFHQAPPHMTPARSRQFSQNEQRNTPESLPIPHVKKK
jgi:serine/threonine protein kinase